MAIEPVRVLDKQGLKVLVSSILQIVETNFERKINDHVNRADLISEICNKLDDTNACRFEIREQKLYFIYDDGEEDQPAHTRPSQAKPL